MRIFLSIAAIALLITSCNSKKSTKETEPAVPKDTAAVVTPDTSNHNVKMTDVEVKEPDLGGVGELSLGLTNTKVIELLGQPKSKSKVEEWGADGLMHQDWFYNDKGITLNMSSGKDIVNQDVNSITITNPCTFRTKKNIGIGSSYNEVMAAYEKEVDKTMSTKESVITGSIYGGIFFNFVKDKVTKIFVGAGAE